MSKNNAYKVLTENQVGKYTTDLQEQEKIADIITKLNIDIIGSGRFE